MARQEYETVRYTASLVSQGEHRFYTLTMPADVLARTCFVTNRDEDPAEGFQRLLNKSRAKEIAEYIDSGFGTIPTSVVLSAQADAEFEYSRSNKTVSFKEAPHSFLILDGQHRVYGFRLAKSDLRVPVVIYAGLSRIDETRLFIDINTTQKPVPNELLLDIRRLAQYQDDSETTLGEVFDLFDTEPNNPLLGKMSARARKRALISRVTFNAAFKPLLGLFSTPDPHRIFEIMSAYYSSTLRQISENKVGIDITNPVAFRGITMIFPDVAQRVADLHGREYLQAHFDDVTSDIYSRVKPSALKSAGNSVKAYAQVLTLAMKPRSIF
ncbi:DGQHR domain-containing protein [Sphingomonas guangdongensis]|uniref:DGQHR domain-containing protein n=1 Tax=Sphingomonas guangdongensis TaxID=1141890 RepID=A0A285QC28_9SPHN|nr:DGQHR domain-containing protein [Sphingomonas guangdongensis]SOB79044.1 DGQHR domain-containing protein [Sphingomonas guangdongensis]